MLTGNTDHAAVARKWFDGYFQARLVEFGTDGLAEKVALYLDPQLDFKCGFTSPLGGLFPAFYLSPFAPSLAEKLFSSAVAGAGLEVGTGTLAGRLLGLVSTRWATLIGIGFSMPSAPPVPWFRVATVTTACLLGIARLGSKKAAAKSMAALALFGSSLAGLVAAAQGLASMYIQVGQLFLNSAVELGRDDVAARMRDLLEIIGQPQRFGDGNFGFFYHLQEKYPRGQISANLMLAEVNDVGGWRRFFTNRTYHDRFDAPTVEGVDFPSVGLSQAWNDPEAGTLTISTYASTPSKTGLPTSFRVINLLPAERESVTVMRDGESYSDWTINEDGTCLEISASIATHTYVVCTGYTGPTGVDTSGASPTFRSRL